MVLLPLNSHSKAGIPRKRIATFGQKGEDDEYQPRLEKPVAISNWENQGPDIRIADLEDGSNGGFHVAAFES